MGKTDCQKLLDRMAELNTFKHIRNAMASNEFALWILETDELLSNVYGKDAQQVRYFRYSTHNIFLEVSNSSDKEYEMNGEKGIDLIRVLLEEMLTDLTE